jgi:hypothetical protein
VKSKTARARDADYHTARGGLERKKKMPEEVLKTRAPCIVPPLAIKMVSVHYSSRNGSGETNRKKSCATLLQDMMFVTFWVITCVTDFLLTFMAGAKPTGETSIYLNARVGHCDAVVRQRVGQLFENGVSEVLASHPLTSHLAPILSKACGGVAGLAVLASSDEALTRRIGEAIAAALSTGGIACAADCVHETPVRCTATLVFVRGSMCVIRLRVNVSSDDVASCVARVAGPSAESRWRSALSMFSAAGSFGSAVYRFLDGSSRALVAYQFCRVIANTAPGTLSDSIRSSCGLRVSLESQPAEREADFLFAELEKQDRTKDWSLAD